MKHYKTKRGVTSIYIIVVTSLLFGIITISFIKLILNEMQKSADNDLYQSAYDSALAGIEDAKNALSQYYTCLNNDIHLSASQPNGDGTVSCQEKLYYINYDADHPDYCDAIANILNRNGESTDASGMQSEVKIEETNSNNSNITQAYTCVKVNTTPSDYRSTLSSTNTIRVIPLKPTIDAENIKTIRISWYSLNNGTEYNFNNINHSNGKIEFNSLNDSSAATPPTIVAQLFQTAENFNLSQFDNSEGDATNRGTLWLVPTDRGDGVTSLGKSELIDSNKHNADQTIHSGKKINCSQDASREFACSVEIELPNPIGGVRKNKTGTFLLALSLPYSQPNTDFKIEMLESTGVSSNFDNVQVAVDSTGRANDIFRRVEGRIEFYDINFPFPEYAMQLGADDNGDSLSKKFWVTYNCWSANNGTLVPCAGGDSDNI